MQELAKRVLRYIRQHDLVRSGDRIGLAVSGGADSVAMLRLMLELRGELGASLVVLHFNHQLRGAESDMDEQFVQDLAVRHKLHFQRAAGNVKSFAAQADLSTEASARHLRYEFFKKLLAAGEVGRVATAHTLDDQAETVLLRAVRGAGTAGLAAIYPSVSVAGGAIVRPLLQVRRPEIEAYLNEIKQPWREDRSNRDLRHARNRVRHGIMPRLERNLNPSVRESLADTAEIARAEEEYWASEVERALPSVVQGSGPTVVIRPLQLCVLPLALQRRLVRTAGVRAGVRLDFKHVEDVLEVCGGNRKSAALPGGWCAARKNPDEVRFEIEEGSVADYDCRLPVPGCAEVPALCSRFEAVLISGPAGYPAEHLFDAALLDKELLVRNWRAGDRFWPAHTKAPAKVKELLQERHITGPERKLWPVVVSGQEVLWMRGFPRPQSWECRPGSSRAILIREVTLGSAGPDNL